MKQKLLSALLMSAFAGVATTASAGVIQASYKNYAAEVFGTDAVVLTAPTIGYALALPLTGTVANPNNFTITWTLDSGEWEATATPNAIVVSSDNGTFKVAQSVTIDPTNKKVLKATFVVDNNFTTGSQIILGLSNPTTSVGAEAKVTKVGTKLGAPAANNDGCSDATADVKVSVKLTNAAGAEFDSNFAGAPLSNTTPIVQSGVALKLVTASSSSALFDNDSDSATAAVLEQSRVDVLQPSLGKTFVDGAADVTASVGAPRVINLGQVVVTDRNTLFDLNATNPYTSQNIIVGAAGVTNGAVEVGVLNVVATGKFIAGGKVFLSPNSACGAAPAASEFSVLVGAGGANSVTLKATDANVLTVLTAAGAADLSRRTNICYEAPGTGVIPTAQFALTGSLLKKAASLEATNNVCPGNLYNLAANGVQVDVRNYIPAIVEAPSGGWKNVVRIINTDESQPSVDVIGTALLRDGTIGASAVIAAGMTPREVRYLSSAEIDAKLNAAATATAKTFSTDDIAANARLRITAPSASIRVQNYHFNPATGNYLEASAAQGDDGVVNGGVPTIADVIRARADGQNK